MSMIKKATTVAIAALATTVIFHSPTALACACGCGVFEVSTNTMYPSGPGGTASLEYDFLDQTINHSGNSSSPSADNDDKRLRSDFYTAGLQYMFNRSWGVNVNVPYVSRSLDTDVGGGDVEGFDHRGLGDVRVSGVYTGLSEDMSTGLEFGLKLPTGSYTMDGFDRDTELGTGSTNVMLGAYQRGFFAKDSPYNWFLHGIFDVPVLTQEAYRPGNEFDAAAGIARNPVRIGGGVSVAPVVQVLNSLRASDSGVQSDPDNTGYERVLVSPGLEFSYGSTRLYTDVSVPVYQHMDGNQLVAPILFQATVSYDF
jgi:hypothetical protein